RRRELEWSRGAREQLQRIIAASGTHRAASFFQLTVNTQNLLAYRSDVLSEARQNQLMDSLAQLYDRTFREAQRENNLKIYDDAFNRLATLCPYFEDRTCSQLLATADTVKTFFIQKNKAINREITRRNKAFQAAIQAEQRHSLHQRYLFFFLLVATLGLSLFLWQRVRRLQEKVVLEQKAATIKQEALRAQMNPHFISNTINAIESLVNQGRNDEASEYLIDFSRLCRMVIEHSRYAEISLADEIDTLRYFLSLEELRLGDDLEYLLSVDPGLDTAAIRIPPLILQPFVENAIWHGIKNKPVPQRGLLQIEIKRRGKESIELVVEDNGVGRARAREIQSQSVIKQKSWGTTLTQERIAHLKKGLDARLTIEDLTDAKGQAAGTKVSIQLPLKLAPSS
ncbi:MAG: histidine kinase, partial [Bacteroidota bacterium]